MELIDLRTIKPADYNPRILKENAAEKLKESIKKLGCVKPIIVNSTNNTIIAGHQRTKSRYGAILTKITELSNIYKWHHEKAQVTPQGSTSEDVKRHK